MRDIPLTAAEKHFKATGEVTRVPSGPSGRPRRRCLRSRYPLQARL